MNDPAPRQVVLLDGAVLTRLRDELEPDPEICDRFIRDYIALMPNRLNRLDRAVDSMDSAAALDAVLSLKTSSLMIGATLLGLLAADLETKLKLHTTGRGTGFATWTSKFRTNMQQIHECSLQTITGLTPRKAT